MGFPSFPPSGKVVSLMEVLALKGLGIGFGYGLLDIIPKREKRTHTGGYNRRVSAQRKSKLFHRSWSGGPTVQNRTEVLHLSDVVGRRTFRGTNHVKHLTPETFKHLGMKREEEHDECECIGGLGSSLVP